MEMTANALNWFEIPVTDFDRARAFYGAIFDYEMPVNEMSGTKMGFFLHEQGKGIGGSICAGEGYKPSTSGTLVYLNGGADLSVVLERVEAAGGTVLAPKTRVTPEIGYVAILRDTEGNRVALHSMG